MTTYLATTFSPAMMGKGIEASVKEISLADVKQELGNINWISAVSHEITAVILTALLGCEVKFNRANLTLGVGDDVICVIPSFRANMAREFSRKEVETAGYRCFHITVRQTKTLAREYE